MESGLEDRNNQCYTPNQHHPHTRLNGVRPRRPEQSEVAERIGDWLGFVSMESGLEDRNNLAVGVGIVIAGVVSMESGLEDRNNPSEPLDEGS